jgi:hypothetical protein
MKLGRPWRAPGGALLVAVLAMACASAPRRQAPPPQDRTGDPEFVAAVEAAEREFETQADALAAGVYEPFVHPDSVRPAAPAAASPAVTRAPAPLPEPGPDDPSTEALLGTLDRGEPYHPGQVSPSVDAARASGRAVWTLQVGAFGAETGALVRLRQLARDFPDLPRWHAVESGLFRVYLGRFAEAADAERMLGLVVERGYADAWVLRAP